MSSGSQQRAVLIVLDGFGIGKDSPFNAINNSQMPFYRGLLTKYPTSQLVTHGMAVGLPDGVMGNSEVGHMTMGAGRIIYQDLTRISKAIEEKTFHNNETLRKTIEVGAAQGRVHLMGLLSDGGVHSHISHLEALLDLCIELRVPRVSIHAFTDGRDTSPRSAAAYMQRLLRHEAFTKGVAVVASIAGRYWAMDRDKRWDRVEKAYLAMTGKAGVVTGVTPGQALEKSYADGKTDEFIEPICLVADAAMRDGDSAIFFNYRSDRAREISEALTSGLAGRPFEHFATKPTLKLKAFCGMTVYDKNTKIDAAFLPQSLENIFGQWLEKQSLNQLRIAETEKYAHVTFFFNGGREEAFKGEDRVLVPSPRDVPTYDLKPEMSAYQVAAEAAQRLEAKTYDFVVMNFANADMVGHTGNYEAAIQAMIVLDRCLAQVVGAAERSGYHVLLTADHGNAEEMQDCNGEHHTQHTLNPVPAIWVAPNTAIAPRASRKALQDGTLEDVMPTLCDLMGLPVPHQVTGKSLL